MGPAAKELLRGTVRSPAKSRALVETPGGHTARASDLQLVEADLESDPGWAEAVVLRGSS